MLFCFCFEGVDLLLPILVYVALVLIPELTDDEHPVPLRAGHFGSYPRDFNPPMSSVWGRLHAVQFVVGSPKCDITM